mmetsp:Transcript_27708/g.41071  ORF Transcript_27708/g.41071 Transcript_27708/m.41071 type:complete len:369 (-) Transcript_27708:1150-2256(-)
MRLLAGTIVKLSIISNEWRSFVHIRMCRIVETLEISVKSLKSSSLNTGGGSSETSVHNFFSKSDCLEYLSSLVTLQCRNSHLTHDLEQSFGCCITVVGNNLLVREWLSRLGLNQTIRIHLANCLISYIRTYSITSVSHQGGEIVNLLCISSLCKNSSLGTLLRLEQMLMNSTDGNKRRKRHPIRSRQTIGEDHSLYSTLPKISLNGICRFVTNTFKSLKHTIYTKINGESCINHLSRKSSSTIRTCKFLALERIHLFQGKKGMTNNKTLTVFGTRRRQKILLWSNGTYQRHDNFLTNGINGRIRHLRKELLEVIIHLPGFLRQDRKSRIITHTSKRLLSTDGHGKQEHLNLFLTESKQVQSSVGGIEI